ncbi:DUF4296 domain-containing protein [Pontibacter arcticus]|uniref:DUF4296 domain-containing protein n=2 Tax=Pontibacter arcticus TaxID=2080288 RepID=A0A364RGR2_9BACT|nr:DUF4296 domain-containing protein [Pontibacter arcticus]
MVPQEKMVQILADVHTAEAQIEQRINYPDTAMMAFNAEQAKILKKYGVQQNAFRETYNYYIRNLAEMDKLYEIIVDTLTVRESKMNAKAGIENLETDEGRQEDPYIPDESELEMQN